MVSGSSQASLPSGVPAARALPPCLESTTAPVRHFFQDVNYGSTEVGRALEEARLNQRRVALERRSSCESMQHTTPTFPHTFVTTDSATMPTCTCLCPLALVKRSATAEMV